MLKVEHQTQRSVFKVQSTFFYNTITEHRCEFLVKSFSRDSFFATFCAEVSRLLLTVYHHKAQSRTHVVQHMTHDAVKKNTSLGLIFLFFAFLCS